MGSASSLVVNTDHKDELRALFTDKSKREKLFSDIINYKLDPNARSASKDKVDLAKLVVYFKDHKHDLHEGFQVNSDILKEALKFAVIKKQQKQKSNTSAKKNAYDEKLSLNDFHQFLPILLLFTRVWKLFDVADKGMINDQKIFKVEFMSMRTHLQDFQDIQILGQFTEEQWEKEWEVINTNKDNYIDFHELCEYCLTHIHKAFNYADFIDEPDTNDDIDTFAHDAVVDTDKSLIDNTVTNPDTNLDTNANNKDETTQGE